VVVVVVGCVGDSGDYDGGPQVMQEDSGLYED